MISSIVMLIVTFLGTIAVLVIQWSKEHHDIQPTMANAGVKRRRNSILLAVGILLALAALYAGADSAIKADKSDRKNDSLTNELLAAKDTIISLQWANIDSTGKVIKTQNQLINQSIKIWEFQKESLNQITGGSNMPIIFSTIQSSTNYDGNENHYKHFLNHAVYNAGNTLLKELRFTANDPYYNVTAELFTDSSGGYTYTQNDTQFKSTPDFKVDNYPAMFKEMHLIQNEILSLAPKKSENLCQIELPHSGKTFFYGSRIKWQKGSYEHRIIITRYENSIYFQKSQFFVEGKLVEDVYKFFGLPRPEIKPPLESCGKLEYRSEVFEVVWDSKNKSIFLISPQRLEISILDFIKTYNKSDSKKNAKRMMDMIFG